MVLPRLLALGFVLLQAACALSAPPAEATLTPDSKGGGSVAGTSSLQRAAELQVELDAAARQQLEAARRSPDDVALQVLASATLFQAADLRLQRAVLAWLDGNPEARRKAVLAAEDHVGDPARTEILSLCTTGLELCERALKRAPGTASACLHHGLHLSLVAWANGPARSLIAGYGPRLTAAIDAALAADRDFDHGGPLRLQGRFRSQAPWPYGDLAAATTALSRAVELASLPVNHLFYGDALAAAGDQVAAEAQWRLAIAAPADESTRWSADLLRELARRRLAAKP